MTSVLLQDLTHPEIAHALEDQTTPLLPLGQTEQHL